jgi:hypothetical protein
MAPVVFQRIPEAQRRRLTKPVQRGTGDTRADRQPRSEHAGVIDPMTLVLTRCPYAYVCVATRLRVRGPSRQLSRLCDELVEYAAIVLESAAERMGPVRVGQRRPVADDMPGRLATVSAA